MPSTWFITGATRGIGAEVVRAGLAAGDRVVATGRGVDALRTAFGPDDDRFLCLPLDVTRPEQARDAVAAAVARFGSLDVLVNNAGYGQLGLFEETTAAEAQAQFATNVFGAFEVTRAVLPVMRRQRSGRMFNLSSIAGVAGGAGYALYCASKFALEGFSESLAAEVAEFGIRVTIVEPGYFRTDFLDPRSIRFGRGAVADYGEVSTTMRETYQVYNHRQPGDPAKLAAALVRLVGEAHPPMRFAAGSDAYGVVAAKARTLAEEAERWRDLTVSTDGSF